MYFIIAFASLVAIVIVFMLMKPKANSIRYTQYYRTRRGQFIELTPSELNMYRIKDEDELAQLELKEDEIAVKTRDGVFLCRKILEGEKKLIDHIYK